jgi:hypothetical protein
MLKTTIMLSGPISLPGISRNHPIRGGNLLFKNDGHGRFKDITQNAGVGLAAHSSVACFFGYGRDMGCKTIFRDGR